MVRAKRAVEAVDNRTLANGKKQHLVKGIDVDTWNRVKARAEAEARTVTKVMNRLCLLYAEVGLDRLEDVMLNQRRALDAERRMGASH